MKQLNVCSILVLISTVVMCLQVGLFVKEDVLKSHHDNISSSPTYNNLMVYGK